MKDPEALAHEALKALDRANDLGSQGDIPGAMAIAVEARTTFQAIFEKEGLIVALNGLVLADVAIAVALEKTNKTAALNLYEGIENHEHFGAVTDDIKVRFRTVYGGALCRLGRPSEGETHIQAAAELADLLDAEDRIKVPEFAAAAFESYGIRQSQKKQTEDALRWFGKAVRVSMGTPFHREHSKYLDSCASELTMQMLEGKGPGDAMHVIMQVTRMKENAANDWNEGEIELFQVQVEASFLRRLTSGGNVYKSWFRLVRKHSQNNAETPDDSPQFTTAIPAERIKKSDVPAYAILCDYVRSLASAGWTLVDGNQRMGEPWWSVRMRKLRTRR